MKYKTAFIAIIIYCLIVFALLTRNGGLMVLIVPLLVYLAVGSFFAPTEIRLRANRYVVKKADESGISVLINVTLTNDGKPLENVLIRDAHFPKTELATAMHEQRLAIPERGEAKVAYSFPANRGHFFWDTIRVSASDPFGLVEIQKDIQASGEILIEPEFEKLGHMHLKPKNTLHSAGLVPARRGGSGLNFWTVREYHLGDSLRLLNWKTIARHPRQLYTTEFEHEEIMEIGLILDARLQTESLFDGELLFEHGVRATMSFAELFLREGNRVGLLVFGQDMKPLQPDYGKRQLHRISNALASATPKSNFSLMYLEYIRKRLFSNRALIVVISPLDLKDLQTYKQLRASGHQILLISPDPISFMAQRAPSGAVLDLALRASRIERYAQLKHLLQMGVMVVDWNVHRSLNEAIRTVFSKRTNRGGYV
jgi:uncharacterized protein (DUF58 family)